MNSTTEVAMKFYVRVRQNDVEMGSFYNRENECWGPLIEASIYSDEEKDKDSSHEYIELPPIHEHEHVKNLHSFIYGLQHTYLNFMLGILALQKKHHNEYQKLVEQYGHLMPAQQVESPVDTIKNLFPNLKDLGNGIHGRDRAGNQSDEHSPLDPGAQPTIEVVGSQGSGDHVEKDL